METIEVFYKQLGDSYFHKYLVYTNSEGDKFFVRAGPSGEAGTDWIGQNSTSYGTIAVQSGVYESGSIDFDAEEDDPGEVVLESSDLAVFWDAIVAEMNLVASQNIAYQPLGPNGNSAIDDVLGRIYEVLFGPSFAGYDLAKPDMDGYLENWAPGSDFNLDGATEFQQIINQTDELGDMMSAIIQPGGGLAIDTGNFMLGGNGTQISIVRNVSLGDIVITNGLLLTSGDSTPPLSDTSDSYSHDTHLPGDEDLTAIVGEVFSGNKATFDAVSLQFDFETTDPDAASIVMDVVFASEEYPEFTDQFPDIAAVIVNGVNYAYFDGDTDKPLSVLGQNVDSAHFIDNEGGILPIEYDGVSHVLTILAPITDGVNTIKIAIADTGDHIYDSGIFVTNIRTSHFSADGVLLNIGGGDGDDDLGSSGDKLDEFFDGGAGNDSVDGGGGDDLIDLGDGDDMGTGGNGKDVLLGGNGDDFLAGTGTGKDKYEGGDGEDTVSYASTTQGVFVDLEESQFQALGDEIGKDQLIEIENVIGGSGKDRIFGDSGDNELDGSGGADELVGRGGNDLLMGWEGADKLNGGSGADELNGGASGDELLGGAGADSLFGGAGSDVLNGGGGNDLLAGGEGKDRLVGGAGDDTYRFDAALARTGVDTIEGFVPGSDEVMLDLWVYTGLLTEPGNPLSADEFVANNKGLAKDENDHIIYNKATGALFYDADGTGEEAAIQIAVLIGKPVLHASDILVGT